MQQRVDPRRGILDRARRDLGVVERAQVGEEIVEIVGVTRLALRDEPLQLELQRLDHRGIEQLAELFRAEQVAEEVAVERERGHPPLGERRVALVHVDRDPAEQQALRERRRVACLDRHDAHASATARR